MRRETGMLVVGRLAAAALAVGVLASAGPATRPAGAGLDPARVAEHLASNDFAVRQRATFDLLDAGPEALPVLRQLLADNPGPEVALRARLIGELLYTRVALPVEEQAAFVGISMEPAEGEPQPGGEHGGGVAINRILPYMPAERAGLRVGDVIVAVGPADGPAETAAPLTPLPPRFGAVQAFPQLVTARPPGARLSLRVLRDGQPLTVTLATTAKPLCFLSLPEREALMSRFADWYVRQVEPTAKWAEVLDGPLASAALGDDGGAGGQIIMRGGPLLLPGGNVIINQGQVIQLGPVGGRVQIRVEAGPGAVEAPASQPAP